MFVRTRDCLSSTLNHIKLYPNINNNEHSDPEMSVEYLSWNTAAARETWSQINMHYLAMHTNMIVRDHENESIILPMIGLGFSNIHIETPPHEFEAWFATIMEERTMEVSRLFEQPKHVIAVPDDFGKTIIWQKKTENKEHNTCSICMDEFKTRNKVRELCSSGCRFHKRCIKRWFKNSSKCPNCNNDCASFSV